MSKRLFDIVAAAIGLALLAPLLLVVALWVRLDSPGPVLFRQQRVGRGGVLFEILKFRTMRHSTAAQPLLTVGKDSRITRAGAILRRYKIDELPQLTNVLLGEMSLVGPRPEVPHYVACYPQETRAIVLSVAPGITDWASILYRDESAVLGRAEDPEKAYLDIIMPAKLSYCVRYVQERSFWLDLHILLKTVAVLLRRREP